MGDTTDDAFAQEWIQSWNDRDLDTLLSLYADDVEFRSALVIRLSGDPTGLIRGKHNLREYFEKALAAFQGELDLKLLGVYRGVESIVVLFESKGRHGAEFMELNGEGKIRRALAHHRVASPSPSA